VAPLRRPRARPAGRAGAGRQHRSARGRGASATRGGRYRRGGKRERAGFRHWRRDAAFAAFASRTCSRKRCR
jgi:hypothetical protein